ncbi:MAG: hypothetical protein ACRDHY_14485, partial [Anaerolineales bacterium]
MVSCAVVVSVLFTVAGMTAWMDPQHVSLVGVDAELLVRSGFALTCLGMAVLLAWARVAPAGSHSLAAFL